MMPVLAAAEEQHARPAPPPVPTALLEDDHQFLDEVERIHFRYFLEQADAVTGLVKDRCNIRADDKSTVASIAATGFGLTALCIGEKRAFIQASEARERALVALRFLSKKLP